MKIYVGKIQREQPVKTIAKLAIRNYLRISISYLSIVEATARSTNNFLLCRERGLEQESDWGTGSQPARS